MLSKSLNYIYKQRDLRFPSRPDHCLFKDGCQIAASIVAGLTEHTDSGFADNKYCFNLVFYHGF